MTTRTLITALALGAAAARLQRQCVQAGADIVFTVDIGAETQVHPDRL